MSLERKDVRFKLDHDEHAGLAVLAEVDRQDIGEWCEAVIRREIVRRVHEATLVAQRTQGLGIAGKSRESSGAAAK